ncbi:hypothetical protein K439DRAFT_717005 [Ramaria rubella]|nr:hypothetical protein K439DRAFT_717005 [Ramaria rubella]
MAIWGYRRKMRHLADVAQRIGNTEPTDRQPPHLAPTDSTASPVRRHRHGHSSNAGLNRQISSVTFARLTTLLSLLSLTWFITAHILTYTSIHTCRLSAPHLWWLTFGIICIGYLVIVEVIVVALLVFIVGPLIFLLLNVILICMGRNPIRHPNHLHPEVGKLSPKAVDRIPLVLYIPAPTPKATPTIITPPEDSSPLSAPQIAVPEPAHVHAYPPEPERPNLSPTSTSGTRVQSRSRRLFTFRRIRKGHKGDAEKGKEKLAGTPDEEQGYSYEDKWEKGEYPFVKLEDNRAACAICLSDFEEPKRIRYSMDSKPPEDLDQAEKGLGSDLVVPEMEGEGDGGLRLTEAGEGAQPLRLLACAHVFHKTCLDPWLTEMSGRCPVCQRAVEVSESSNGGRASRRR